MKAACPKCGRTLHIWNWKQDCPFCGVNIIGYDLQARLLRDADEAETEFARVQPYFDRGKASYIGSKWTIARLCCNFLPLPALLLPLAQIRGRSLNVVGVVQWIVDAIGKKGGVFAVGGAALPDRTLVLALASAALLVWTTLLLLAHIGFIAGSCSRPGRMRLYDLDARMLLSTLVSLTLLHLFCRMLPAAAALTVGWGAYAFLALLAVLVAFDIALRKIGIPVKHKVCYIRGIPADEFFAAQAKTEAAAT